MVELTPKRQLRREAFKDRFSLVIADRLNQELVEDILASAPKANFLQFDVLEDKSFDTTLLMSIPDIERLKILEGNFLEEINLKGLGDMKYLLEFELNVIPQKSLDELNLTPLAGHEEIKVITVACPAQKLILENLNTCRNLQSIGLYTLDLEELDLSPLSGTKVLESIFIGDFGKNIDEPQTFSITLPKNIPLKLLNISEAINTKLQVEIDFSFLEGLQAMDEISLRNCNFVTFDLSNLTALERIGRIDLTNNPMTHLDITPLIEMPMYTEKALGETPFVIDESVVIQIEKSRKEDIERILELPDVILDYHDGHFAIEYEFGHQWLKTLMTEHEIQWI